MPPKPPKERPSSSNAELFKQILAKEAPNFEPAATAPGGAVDSVRTNRAKIEAVTPDRRAIKEKLAALARASKQTDATTAGLLKEILGRAPENAVDSPPAGSDHVADLDDIQISTMKPKGVDPLRDDAPPPKAAVWSKSRKRIEGMQG